MAEPMFGTVSPIWSAIPSPGVAWLQAPMSRASPIGGTAAGMTAGTGPAASFGAAFPAYGSPDVAAGVTAPALVSAIAMRRGQPAGPTSDPEIEDFIYDALDLLPGSGEVEVRCDGGRASLMGTVSQKRLKRDIGEIVWAIPAINDVQNTITIAPRRRSRTQNREGEPAAVAGRKTA
jgi:BON domain